MPKIKDPKFEASIDDTALRRFWKRASKGFAQVGKVAAQSFKGLATVTAAISGVGFIALKRFSALEDALRQVQAVANDTAEDQVKVLGAIRENARTSLFTAEQTAEAMQFLRLAGQDANQSIATLPSVLQLATAANISLQESADKLTDTMSQFGLQAKDSASVADVFAKAQSQSNHNVTQLTDALIRTGASANLMGQSIESTAAALGLLADQGVKAEMGGSGLNSLFNALGKNAEDIAETGVAVYDASGQFVGLDNIVAQYEKTLDGATDAQKAATLGKVGDTQAQKALSLLIAGGSEKLREQTIALENSAGAAKQSADIIASSLSGRLKLLGSSWDDLLIDVGASLAPLARKLLDWAPAIIDHIKNVFRNAVIGVATFRLRVGKAIRQMYLPFVQFNSFLNGKITAGITRFAIGVLEILSKIPGVGSKFDGVIDNLQKGVVRMERGSRRAVKSIEREIESIDKKIAATKRQIKEEQQLALIGDDTAGTGGGGGSPSTPASTAADEANRAAEAEAALRKKQEEEDAQRKAKQAAREQAATAERIRQIGLRGDALKRELSIMNKAELDFANRQAELAEASYQAGLIVNEKERKATLDNIALKQQMLDEEIAVENEKRLAAKAEYDTLLQELQIATDATVEEQLEAHGERIKEIDTALKSDLLTAEQKASLEKQRLALAVANEQIKQAKRVAAEEKAARLTSLANYQTVSGNILALAKEAGIENSAIAKAASIASIIANTATGIIRSQADLPAPLSWANSAAIGALGAVQLAKVAGLERGGVIPSTFPTLNGAGLGSDNVGVRLMAGEAVIPSGVVGQLESFLDAQGQQPTQSQSVEVNIELDGEVIARAVANINEQRGV